VTELVGVSYGPSQLATKRTAAREEAIENRHTDDAAGCAISYSNTKHSDDNGHASQRADNQEIDDTKVLGEVVWNYASGDGAGVEDSDHVERYVLGDAAKSGEELEVEHWHEVSHRLALS